MHVYVSDRRIMGRGPRNSVGNNHLCALLFVRANEWVRVSECVRAYTTLTLTYKHCRQTLQRRVHHLSWIPAAVSHRRS